MQGDRDRDEGIIYQVKAIMATIAASSNRQVIASRIEDLKNLRHTPGISAAELAVINQAISDARENEARSGMLIPNDTSSQDKAEEEFKRVKKEFEGMLQDLQDSAKLCSALVDELEEKEKEYERLSNIIKEDPSSEKAKKAREDRMDTVLDMIGAEAKLEAQTKDLEKIIETCNNKIREIAENKSFPEEQRKELLEKAKKGIAAAEEALKNAKEEKEVNKASEFFEDSLLEMIAVEVATGKDNQLDRQKYDQIMAQGMLRDEQRELDRFIGETKNLPDEERKVKYTKFEEEFIERIAAKYSAIVEEKKTEPEVIKEDIKTVSLELQALEVRGQTTIDRDPPKMEMENGAEYDPFASITEEAPKNNEAKEEKKNIEGDKEKGFAAKFSKVDPKEPFAAKIKKEREGPNNGSPSR